MNPKALPQRSSRTCPCRAYPNEDGVKLAAEQFGGHARSSGSGNANVLVWRR